MWRLSKVDSLCRISTERRTSTVLYYMWLQRASYTFVSGSAWVSKYRILCTRIWPLDTCKLNNFICKGKHCRKPKERQKNHRRNLAGIQKLLSRGKDLAVKIRQVITTHKSFSGKKKIFSHHPPIRWVKNVILCSFNKYKVKWMALDRDICTYAQVRYISVTLRA